MNIESQPVSSAVKESLHAPLNVSSGKAVADKEFKNLLMNFLAIDAITNGVIRDFLSRLDASVDLLESLGCPPANNRPAQVAKVAVLLRSRKNIEDNRCMRFDRSGPLVVWIDTLIAGGNDRVARQPTLSHDRCIHRRLEHL